MYRSAVYVRNCQQLDAQGTDSQMQSCKQGLMCKIELQKDVLQKVQAFLQQTGLLKFDQQNTRCVDP